ncbi:hypothetical protein PC129_g12253 [Phytophthora cactorum]|uniref:Uncharacterized protein n=1 Tax=Phytophthora cactorum TaxID=29920 RepID=A0A8T1HY61_9STRA|nr:hypothetical protein Pcac1_g10456 [Phytophthora cactorum]KAG2897188.1 hypothetical protein PC114_g14780 [Phytophthora cactorum]KAG2912926.1 hypothetical protein PC117_g18743 [Phytophthora cactorum]KAG3008721.1 hypothetical protein PC120_g16053 [Phytophthora cactorum]KAG3022228.1 hypothetical protein PC119_g9365 [Phytophthora cactorum]
MKAKEESSTRWKSLTELGDLQPSRLTKFEVERRAQNECDPVQMLVNGPDGDMFANGDLMSRV